MIINSKNFKFAWNRSLKTHPRNWIEMLEPQTLRSKRLPQKAQREWEKPPGTLLHSTSLFQKHGRGFHQGIHPMKFPKSQLLISTVVSGDLQKDDRNIRRIGNNLKKKTCNKKSRWTPLETVNYAKKMFRVISSRFLSLCWQNQDN